MNDAADRLGEQDKTAAADSEQKALEEMKGELLRLGQLARRILEEARKADLARQ